ncbi:hypothetical protein F5Y04DRAFT_276541 [Hypomontagnella monticulosa]|nr:hypothetical protein F5Y04DRAFT_276541 [Hypomontagnella monticulosa]
MGQYCSTCGGHRERQAQPASSERVIPLTTFTLTSRKRDGEANPQPPSDGDNNLSDATTLTTNDHAATAGNGIGSNALISVSYALPMGVQGFPVLSVPRFSNLDSGGSSSTPPTSIPTSSVSAHLNRLLPRSGPEPNSAHRHDHTTGPSSQRPGPRRSISHESSRPSTNTRSSAPTQSLQCPDLYMVPVAAKRGDSQLTKAYRRQVDLMSYGLSHEGIREVETARAIALRNRAEHGYRSGERRQDGPISPLWPLEPFRGMDPRFPLPKKENDAENPDQSASGSGSGSGSGPVSGPAAQAHSTHIHAPARHGGPWHRPHPLGPRPSRRQLAPIPAPESRTQTHRLSAIPESRVSESDLENLQDFALLEGNDREEALMSRAIGRITQHYEELENAIYAKVCRFAKEDDDDIAFMIDCILSAEDNYIDSCLNGEDCDEIVEKKVDELRQSAQFVAERGLVDDQKRGVRQDLEKKKQEKAAALAAKWNEKIDQGTGNDAVEDAEEEGGAEEEN